MLILILLPFLLFGTPTETFINEHGAGVIESEIIYKLAKPEVYQRFTPLFNKAIQNEKQPGFFGYHATSLDASFFHDILREVFEKKLEIALPADFYFLRTPGDLPFKMTSASEYLSERKEAPITEEVIREGIEKAFLLPLSAISETKITFEDLTLEEREQLFRPVLEAHNLLADLYHEMTEKLAIKKGAKSQLPIPLYQLMMKIKESAQNQFSDLLEDKEITTSVGKTIANVVERKQQTPLCESQIALIVSLTSEEMPLLRILELAYNLNLKEETPYVRWFVPFNDNDPKNSTRLVSINIPLFGNIFNRGDSTVHVFLTGKTVAKNDAGLAFLLEDYFDKIGLRRSLASQLFEQLHALFSGNEPQYGVLYQFFDMSQEMQFIDKLAYVSFPYGPPAAGVLPSEIALETREIDYGGQQAQFRLLMSTKESLNPFGKLKIKRYDSLRAAKRAEARDVIRKALEQEQIDPIKSSLYKRELLSIWLGKGK